MGYYQFFLNKRCEHLPKKCCTCVQIDLLLALVLYFLHYSVGRVFKVSAQLVHQAEEEYSWMIFGVVWLGLQLLRTSLFSSHLHGHPEANSFEEGAAGPMTSDGFGVCVCVCVPALTEWVFFWEKRWC